MSGYVSTLAASWHCFHSVMASMFSLLSSEVIHRLGRSRQVGPSGCYGKSQHLCSADLQDEVITGCLGEPSATSRVVQVRHSFPLLCLVFSIYLRPCIFTRHGSNGSRSNQGQGLCDPLETNVVLLSPTSRAWIQHSAPRTSQDGTCKK